MDDINLIPKKLKREIEFKKLLSFINRAIVVATVFLFIYLSIFIIGKYILEEHYKKTKESFALTNLETDINTNKLDEINKKINFVDGIEEDEVVWSKLIYDFSLIDTSGISIESLHLDKEKKIFNIRGNAQTRDRLLTFKSDLEKIPYLSEIVLPLQSLFKKEDISFDINANISSYDFQVEAKN